MKKYFLPYNEYTMFETYDDDEFKELGKDVWSPEERYVSQSVKRTAQKVIGGVKRAVVGVATGVATGAALTGVGAYKLVKIIQAKVRVKKMLDAEKDPIKRENLRFQLSKLDREQIGEKMKLKKHQATIANLKQSKMHELTVKLHNAKTPQEKKSIQQEIEHLQGKKKD